MNVISVWPVWTEFRLFPELGRVWDVTLQVSQQVHLSQFHGCWQKTQDSWVRDKGPGLSTADNMSFMLALVSLVPRSLDNAEVACHTYYRSVSQSRKPSFRNYSVFKGGASKPAQPLLPEAISSGNKSTLCPRETLSLFLRLFAVHLSLKW